MRDYYRVKQGETRRVDFNSHGTSKRDLRRALSVSVWAALSRAEGRGG